MLIKPIEAKNQNSVYLSVWRNKGFKILIFSVINKNILDRNIKPNAKSFHGGLQEIYI